jgi:hypothetical protein
MIQQRKMAGKISSAYASFLTKNIPSKYVIRG